MEKETILTKEEMFLFNEGTFYHCYLKFGAHRVTVNQIEGVHFALWAPNAIRINVVGDFNHWQGNRHRMIKQGESGVWTLFIPHLVEGELYKYEIMAADGSVFLKSDPWGFYHELRPKTASIIYDFQGYCWQDASWLKKRQETNQREQAMNIYEVHLPSWRRHKNGRFLSYTELAQELIPYALDLGFTHLELLPLMEHPLDESWGYQITGYYGATSRLGTPHELMCFIDQCHQAGLGVILDWVPGHFCKNDHGLGRFDGTPIFEGAEHAHWGTYKFNFERSEVWSFLIGNAIFWFDIFHIDGLRVDGVTSMLLLSYGEESTPPKTNVHGGPEDLAAVNFLKTLNQVVFHYYPGVLMMAEESTDWPLVTKPPKSGGLGFNYKWNMGWMNDTLEYMENDFFKRPANHNLLTFSLLYAFSEDFILPFSHDEVVHGKKSLIGKMPGDYWRKFAGLRLLLCYQICHPGKKLLFMGGEFAQFVEWRVKEELEWFLLDYEMHGKFMGFVREINHLYLKEKSLWEIDYDWSGFRWLDVNNYSQSILIFLRQGKRSNGIGDSLLVILNFQPKVYQEFRCGVPFYGEWQEILNTDQLAFGGSGQINQERIIAENIPWHGENYSIKIKIPPLAGLMMKINPA